MLATESCIFAVSIVTDAPERGGEGEGRGRGGGGKERKREEDEEDLVDVDEREQPKSQSREAVWRWAGETPRAPAQGQAWMPSESYLQEGGHNLGAVPGFSRSVPKLGPVCGLRY